MEIIDSIGLLSTSGIIIFLFYILKYLYNSNFYVAAKCLNLLAVTSSVEAGYDIIEEIHTKARKMLDVAEDRKERRQLKTLIMSASSVRPLSANGYFDISRETLTSMTSVR